MNKLIMIKGLPASGKSTWAKEEVAKNPTKTTRVNKDDLRAMMHGSHWSKNNEQDIIAARNDIIVEALQKDRTVIVDDTNLDPVHEKYLRSLAESMDIEFEIQDFTDVPLDECLKRDSLRPNPVGAKVIKSMYNKYLKKPFMPRTFNPELPTCVIVDIDGTLAIMGDRGPFDWQSVYKDTLNLPVAEVVAAINHLKLFKVIIVSGRDGSCRELTEKWLEDHHIKYDEFYMRPKGDFRKDTLIKEEIFRNHIEDKYNVRFVLDDRNQVVKMWRGLGIPVFQVAEGDF